MRCKYCDKRLAPSEYRWDPVLKDHVENCGGVCVLRPSFTGTQPDPEEIDTDDAAIPEESVDEVIVVQQWVPERE